MSKADTVAFEYARTLSLDYDKIYDAVKYGYHQAEKDLELTVKDVIIILDAENNILHECNDNSQLVIETYPKGEDYYSEILKRFKESRKK